MVERGLLLIFSSIARSYGFKTIQPPYRLGNATHPSAPLPPSLPGQGQNRPTALLLRLGRQVLAALREIHRPYRPFPYAKRAVMNGFPFTTVLLFILYSALMLFTGFSLATCQAFTTTQATITNSTSRAIPIKSNRSISIRSLNCSNHIWPVK